MVRPREAQTLATRRTLRPVSSPRGSSACCRIIRERLRVVRCGIPRSAASGTSSPSAAMSWASALGVLVGSGAGPVVVREQVELPRKSRAPDRLGLR